MKFCFHAPAEIALLYAYLCRGTSILHAIFVFYSIRQIFVLTRHTRFLIEQLFVRGQQCPAPWMAHIKMAHDAFISHACSGPYLSEYINIVVWCDYEYSPENYEIVVQRVHWFTIHRLTTNADGVCAMLLL